MILSFSVMDVSAVPNMDPPSISIDGLSITELIPFALPGGLLITIIIFVIIWICWKRKNS